MYSCYFGKGRVGIVSNWVSNDRKGAKVYEHLMLMVEQCNESLWIVPGTVED